MLRLQFGLSVRSNIAGGAAYPDWPAIDVKFDTTMGRDPTYSAIRQHHLEFRLVSAFARDRRPHRLSEAFAIVRVHSAEWHRVSSRSDGANPNNSRHLSLAQISFRARSRIQMPKLAASTAKLIRSSFSRKPASLACKSPTSCDAPRTSRPNS